MPVGPGQEEHSRFVDTVAGLLAVEPAVTSLIVVDDGRRPGGLTTALENVPPHVNVAGFPSPLKRGRHPVEDRITVATLAGMAWASRNCSEQLYMKLDTDAVVIAPFVERLAQRFQASPEVGLLGSFDRMWDGSARNFSPWARPVQALERPVGVRGRRLRVSLGPRGRMFAASFAMPALLDTCGASTRWQPQLLFGATRSIAGAWMVSWTTRWPSSAQVWETIRFSASWSDGTTSVPRARSAQMTHSPCSGKGYPKPRRRCTIAGSRSSTASRTTRGGMRRRYGSGAGDFVSTNRQTPLGRRAR